MLRFLCGTFNDACFGHLQILEHLDVSIHKRRHTQVMKQMIWNVPKVPSTPT